MRWKPLYLILVCLYMSACSLLPNYQNERNGIFINDEDESQFGIELPLATYNFDQCVELEDHNCTGDPNDVFDISIKNTFELWQETKLTFGIVPKPDEVLLLKSLDSVKLYVLDDETLEWIPVAFSLGNPIQYIIDMEDFIFISNCHEDGTCTIYPYSIFVTLVFSPDNKGTNVEVYKLSIGLHKINRETGEASEEIFTSTKVIEFYKPQTEVVREANWNNIDLDPEQIQNSNQSFSFFAPKDINPFMISHPLHQMDGSINLALNLPNDKAYDFHQDLNLKVYQFNQYTQQWDLLEPPEFQVTYSRVGEFIYAPDPKDVICTGCEYINAQLDEIKNLDDLPRLMRNGDESYLLFSLRIDPTKLMVENTTLRIIAHTDHEMAYHDFKFDQ